MTKLSKGSDFGGCTLISIGKLIEHLGPILRLCLAELEITIGPASFVD
jgi:hypothetical protein